MIVTSSCEINELLCIKHLTQCLAHCKSSIKLLLSLLSIQQTVSQSLLSTLLGSEGTDMNKA